MEQTASGNVVINADGSRTEYHEVPTDASTSRAPHAGDFRAALG